jgi:NADPH:quinone reductase-like Zn-dependent oxidoreductase
MKAWRFDRLSSLDDLALHDEPMPRPQRGEVLVGVRAVALNYRDLSMVKGDYVRSARPGLIPCSDAAGEVLEVGEGVTRVAPGDAVVGCFHPRWFGGEPPFVRGPSESYGSAVDGWLAEFKVVSQEALVRMPRGMPFHAAATLPCAGVTAWSALAGTSPVRAGQTVLTLGTGGVSVFALQLAKRFGARVIATTSTPAKAERLRELGADHVINHAEIADWGERARALAESLGVDRVVEVGGPATIRQSLKAVRWGGELVLIGFLTRDNPGIDYFELKGSGAVVHSISAGDRPALEALVDLCEQEPLRPVVDRVFAFGDAREAFEHLASGRHIGKVVVELS